MIPTLTLLTGSYSMANFVWVYQNTKLVKYGKIKTIFGTRDIKPVLIEKEGIMYKIGEKRTNYSPPVYVGGQNAKIPIGGSIEKTYEIIKCGYSFETREPMKSKLTNDNLLFSGTAKYFNTGEDYMNFCKDININPDQFKYTKLQIQYDNVSKDDEVWMLCELKGHINCEVMAKMSEEEFKKLMIQQNGLPLGKTAFCLFLVLCAYIISEYPDIY